jgi:putative membrane protein
VTASSTLDPPARDAGLSSAQRTDPKSFLVRGVGMLTQLAIPLAFAAYSIANEGGWGTVFAFAVPAVTAIIGINFALAYLAWRRLTYTVGEQDIRVESGVLSRSARSVPYERIQDVSLEQKLLPRLFGLVAVKFETGSGGGEDLALTYLSEAEGERLRRVVRTRRAEQAREGALAAGQDVDEAADEQDQGEALFSMSPRRIFIFGTFEFSLAVFAVLLGLTQQFESLLPFDLWDFDAWETRITGQSDYLASLGVAAQVIGGVVATISLIVVGFATGVVRTLLREWDFLLERTERGFRRRRGLLTKTDVVMPVHRVQGVKIGTGFVRRLFGWHSLRFVSLAQDAGASNHVVAPFAQMEEIAPIVEQAGFQWPGEEADWHRASRKYRFDNAVGDALFFLAAAIPVGVFAPAGFVLIPLALAGVAFVANLVAWRFHRHALDAQQILATKGLLAPRSQISTRLKLHSVSISRGPIARWRGYATVHLGLAGGQFSIPGVPIDRALELRDAVMETIAATDFSQLEKA